ncbi:MAG: CRISPR-associated primase-polymerase type A1 [Candidatus Methanospirareceae archaeon]
MTDDQALWKKVCSQQNIRSAWTKVRGNGGGPGVDRVTIEDFERGLNENLTTLQDQLESGDYRPLPVLRFYIDKGDGSKRAIGIAAVRDRVVQQSMLSVLSPIFEEEFLDCSFAYRPGRSSLNAIDRIEGLLNDRLAWVLDGDIEAFFDSIDHDLLMSFVGERIPDKGVLSLIREFLNASIFEDMSLREEYLGISQGSAISPLLANIFLHRFDLEMATKGYHLIRYADDFVVLEESQEMVAKALTDVTATLKSLKLSLNEKKTRLVHAGKGFVFLGYYIDLKGRGPSKKAIGVISRRLHEISQTGTRRGMVERIEDLIESIRGWSVYFRTCRGIEPENDLVLIALIEMSLELDDEENARRLFGRRRDFSIDQADLWYRLGHLAQRLGLREEALDAFSQAISIDPDYAQAKESMKRLDLVDEDIYSSIQRLKKLIHHCPDLPQSYRDLAFCYAELGEYGQAQESYQKAVTLEIGGEPVEKPIKPAPAIPAIPQSPEPPGLVFSDEDASLFASIFRGRNAFFACQWVDEKGRRGFSHVSRPLNLTEIKRHLSGEETIGLYLMDEEDRVRLSAIDIDISQKALLEYAKDEEEVAKLHQLTQNDAARMASICDDLEIPFLIEDSGYKGRHLWFFFDALVPAKLVRAFLKFIVERAGMPSHGVHWEVFPDRDKVKGEGFGPLIKLPLGIHKRTNRRSLFLDREGNPLQNQIAALFKIRHIAQTKIEEILLTYGAKSRTAPTKKTESPLVASLLSGCNVVNYLVKKARDTHYLDNSERVTLLYTLGHLGQEGKDFLHETISNCINYDYNFTEKKIRKLKPCPISCARIREKHEDIAMELGCNCHLKIPPKGYPSPVLHAFKQGQKGWIAQSYEENTRTQENKTTPGDINAKLKRYIELRRHLAGIERSIRRTEEEMASYFDKTGTESISTEYGVLERRRKAGNKCEWIIRL